MVCEKGMWDKDGVWKMVCQSCVGKMVCVKDGVWKMACGGVWKMVCDKVVCVKDGVWQSGVWKMVCDKVVCQRWCVTKLCVKDGVWQSGVCVCVCEWADGRAEEEEAAEEAAEERGGTESKTTRRTRNRPTKIVKLLTQRDANFENKNVLQKKHVLLVSTCAPSQHFCPKNAPSNFWWVYKFFKVSAVCFIMFFPVHSQRHW